MNWFKNMKIATKLISAFVIVSLLAGMMGAVGIYNMNNIDKDYTNLYNDYGVSLGELGSAGMNFNQARVQLALTLLHDDPEKKKQAAGEIEQLAAEIEQHLENFGSTIRSEEVKRKYETIVQSFQKYKALREQIVELSLSGNNEQAIALLTSEGAQLAATTNNYMEELFENLKNDGSSLSSQLTVKAKATEMTMIVIVIALVAVSLAFGFIISRMISKPVNKLV